MKHEHADHPDYKFPVEIEFFGEKPKDLSEEEMYDYWNKVHALIYTDGCIAITLYECTYSMWTLRNGVCIGGFEYNPNSRPLHDPKTGWRLTQESIEKITQYHKGIKNS